MPVQTTSHVTISERMQRIRWRAHLEKMSGISPADKDAYLEMCEWYERGKPLDCSSWSGDWQGDQSGWKKHISWNPFGNFNNYTPDY